MRRRVRALALLALAAASPAGADTLSQADCAELWDLLAGTAAANDLPVRRAGGATLSADGCAVRDIVVGSDSPYAPDITLGRLVWTGEGLMAYLRTGTAPARLDLSVEDLSFRPDTGDATIDYILGVQAAGANIDAAFSLAWDRPARRLTVEAADIDFPGDNMIRLTATVDGMDLSTPGTTQTSAGTFALKTLDLTVQSNGLFEQYLLMPLGNLFLSGSEDPAAAVDALRAEAKAAVAALPETSVAAPSKAALAALLDDMPNPAGTLGLALRAPDGLGPARLARYAVTGLPATMEDLAPVFAGVTVDVTYRRSPAEAE